MQEQWQGQIPLKMAWNACKHMTFANDNLMTDIGPAELCLDSSQFHQSGHKQ
jgi:hypothetical protein